MSVVQEMLLQCPLFHGIEPDELSALLGCMGARTKSASKDESMLSEGEPARDVGILLSGQAQVIRTDYYGNRSIMTHIAPGELFGESFACARAEVLPVSVVAIEDCQYLLIDCRRLMMPCSRSCAFHGRMIFNLLQIVAEKNLALNQRALITGKRTTREKLMAYLLLVAKKAGSDRFSIPFDRQGLADYLEVDRSGLSAEMSKLKKEGVLDYHKNSFRLMRAPTEHHEGGDVG